MDNPHGLVIGDLTEDDVLAIEPGGFHSCDKELRAVAIDSYGELVLYEGRRGR